MEFLRNILWDIFFSLNNIAPNQIMRLHPGFLQIVILCNQSSEVSEKKGSSNQKKTTMKLSQKALFSFSESWEIKPFLHRSCTFWCLLLLIHLKKINIHSYGKDRSHAKDDDKCFTNNYLKLSENFSSCQVRKDAYQNTFFSFWVPEVQFPVILCSFRQVS